MSPAPVNLDYTKKHLVFITGASKGIGKAIAVELSKKFKSKSVFVLIARSQSDLEKLKNDINSINANLIVQIAILDLSNPDLISYDNLFKDVADDVHDIETSVIFHNAGHIGVLKQITDLTDLASWRQYYDLNLFSVALLNSAFIKHFKQISSNLLVVNMTSLCGRVPFPNMAMYGTGKAARELFFKVLATEQPDITILNYSPGPVQTDMFESVIIEAQSDKLRESFADMKNNSVLQPEQTVGRLLAILEKGDYENGDTIDYFDRDLDPKALGTFDKKE